MRLSRRLFVVLLADNFHGKTSIVRSLVQQGVPRSATILKKGVFRLTAPFGREIDAYIYGRSFQESDLRKHKTVIASLNASDPYWLRRELIIMPSHVSNIGGRSGQQNHINQMIDAAHMGGFDAICASLLFIEHDPSGLAQEIAQRSIYFGLWQKPWDERWTLPNPRQSDSKLIAAQLDAIGRDLWFMICRALAP